MAIKPRRLRVEAIEDRLLLSGTSFAITDISLLLHDSNSSGFIVIPADTGITEHFDVNSQGTLSGNYNPRVLNDSGITVSNNWGNHGVLIIPRNTDANNGGNFIRLVIGDLPNQDPHDDMIDVGIVPKPPLDAIQGPMLAKEISDLPRVEIGETSVPMSSNPTPKMGVDGAHDAVQVFEIAAVAFKESNSSFASLAKEPAKTAPLETQLNAARAPSQFAQQTSHELKLAEVHATAGFAYARYSLSTVEQNRLRVSSTDSSQKAIAAAVPTNAAPVRPSERTVSEADFASATMPTKSTAPAEVCRQAVFAEMTEKTVEKAEFPISLGEYRLNNLVGVAIVAIVGQQLSKKWHHSSPLIETHQIPPRRRNLSA